MEMLKYQAIGVASGNLEISIHFQPNNSVTVSGNSHCLPVKAWPGPISSWQTISADNRYSDNLSLEVSRPSEQSLDLILT